MQVLIPENWMPLLNELAELNRVSVQEIVRWGLKNFLRLQADLLDAIEEDIKGSPGGEEEAQH